MLTNPFSFGNPVRYDSFLGRRREVRKIVGRILSGGQSSALVGEPRTGKTSILNYIMSPDTRADLFGADGKSLHFSYFDALTLGDHITQPDFWEHAFLILKDVGLVAKGASLESAYKECRGSGFSTFMLERLLARMAQQGLKLTLVVDEFDALLFHKTLNRGEFFGGLRSLASRYDSLAIVIASRQSLTTLNQKTQELSRTGSPFFNIFEEIPVPPLDDATIDALLKRSGKRFPKRERDNLKMLAGGHPYLLQVAAHALWEAYEEDDCDAEERWQAVCESLYRQAAPTLEDTWRLWPPEMKKTFATVALDCMPTLLGQKKFSLTALFKALLDYGSELRELKMRGFIKTDADLEGGYAVSADVMLWWLAEQLVLALRQGDDLGAWLRAQQWDGMFTAGEKAQFLKAITGLGEMAKKGMETFIMAAAKGFGEGMSGA